MSKGSRIKEESIFSYLISNIADIVNMTTVGIIAAVLIAYFVIDAVKEANIEEMKQMAIQEKNCLDSKGTMNRKWGTWYCSHEGE